MHVPHDIEPKNQAQRLTLLASTKNDDAAEADSDRLGAPLIPEGDDASGQPAAKAEQRAAAAPAPAPAIGAKVVEAAAGTVAPAPPSTTAADTTPALPATTPIPGRGVAWPRDRGAQCGQWHRGAFVHGQVAALGGGRGAAKRSGDQRLGQRNRAPTVSSCRVATCSPDRR